jgi:hypothetical protein
LYAFVRRVGTIWEHFSSHHGSLIDQGLSWSFDPEAAIDCPVQSDDPKSRADLLIGPSRKHDEEPSISTGGMGDKARHDILALGHFDTLTFVSGLLLLTTHVVLDMSTYRELIA